MSGELLRAADILERHNKWRRGDDEYEMANPKELGIAIEAAVIALRSNVTLSVTVEEIVRLLADSAEQSVDFPPEIAGTRKGYEWFASKGCRALLQQFEIRRK